MKALSVRQPWAWLIVEGYKPVENRTWPTRFRGDMLIHASSGCTEREYLEAQQFIQESVRRVINLPRREHLELGGLVGMVRLVDCVRYSQSPWFAGPYGLVLEKPYPLPFRPMRGFPGLFEVNALGEPVCPESCRGPLGENGG